MKKLLTAFLILLFLAPTLALAARTPSLKSAQSITKKYLDKYGKEYPASVFGQYDLDTVEINQVKELAKNLSSVEAFVSFLNGKVARVLMTFEKKPPFGWRVKSWELYDVR